MRSGIVFATGSILLAWALTAVAVASPLTEAWRSLDGVWTSVRDQFEGVFGTLTNPQSRISGNSFGNSFVIQGEWVSVDEPVLVLAAPRPLYLRTKTYDIYNGRGWDTTPTERRDVAAGQNLFARATSERPVFPDAVAVDRIGIEMRQAIGRNLFTAGSPLQVYAPTVIHEPGGQPLLAGIEHANALGEGEAYELTVAVSRATEAELGEAGTEYPPEVAELYLNWTGVPTRVQDLARDITRGADNNYERVRALAAYLSRDPSFTYATTAPVPPGDQDLVDFFLFDPEFGQTGYCQYYASAMVIMARSLGIPARLAAGFAPGERQDDGTFLYREANAHAWAEVYFPGYGWEIFEATKSIQSRFGRASGEDIPGLERPDFGLDPLAEEEFLQQRLGEGDGLGALPSPDLVPGAIDPDEPDAAAADEGAPREGNALLIAIIALGRRISAQADDITRALDGARENTAPLYDVKRTNLAIDQITRGLRTVRTGGRE
jgi:transglutaminase-like putative cysteine protease